jgi:hypothetical protein
MQTTSRSEKQLFCVKSIGYESKKIFEAGVKKNMTLVIFGMNTELHLKQMQLHIKNPVKHSGHSEC